ncbi:MAG: hypothetical protein AB1630_08845 [bacterium]
MKEKEEIIYGKTLSLCVKLGIFLLITSFIVYIFGILPPYIPIENLSKYWAMPSEKYLKSANIPSGWSWISLTKFGDFLNFIPIVFLSAITIICFLAILPIFYKKKDKTYLFLAILQVIILLLAASGILTTGSH